jgi:hypothetical protein
VWVRGLEVLWRGVLIEKCHPHAGKNTNFGTINSQKPRQKSASSYIFYSVLMTDGW